MGSNFPCTPKLIVPSKPDLYSITLVFFYRSICIAKPDFLLARSQPPTWSLVFFFCPWSSDVKLLPLVYNFHCTPQLIVPPTPNFSSITLVLFCPLIHVSPPDRLFDPTYPVPIILLPSLVFFHQIYSSGFEFYLHSTINSSHPPLIYPQSSWSHAANRFTYLPLISHPHPTTWYLVF